MPKVVNWSASKEAIARAVWEVMRERGWQGLSVRTIAHQADMPASTLRHYFPSQAELLLFSMQLIAEQVQTRLQTMPQMPDSAAVLRYAAEQFLPLDAERQFEVEIWLYFVSEASHHQAMRELRATLQAEVTELFAALLRDTQIASLVAQAAYEARRLQALIDGLALHYVTSPSAATQREVLAVLEQHLAKLLEQKGV